MVSVKVDVYRRLYLTDAREYERNARSEKILSFRTLVGINGFYVTIHYTESFVTEETLARTHEGVGEGLFKPCTHKRIRSNYARDIKLEQRVRVWCERFNAGYVLDRCSLWCKSEIFISLSVALIIPLLSFSRHSLRGPPRNAHTHGLPCSTHRIPRGCAGMSPLSGSTWWFLI